MTQRPVNLIKYYIHKGIENFLSKLLLYQSLLEIKLQFFETI
jgi:hypothetical protein